MPLSPVPSAPLVPGGADLLKAHGLPEHAPVEQLQALTRVAAALCGTPVAVVNLLDENFQHQVGEVGFAGRSTDVADSMCAVGLRRPGLRHIPDATQEPAFAGNPWVDGRIADIRFYASAPIVLTGGGVIGSLCVFADEPGYLRPAQLDALADLARQAAVLIEQAHQARESAGQAALFRLVAEGSADVLCRHSPDGTVHYVSPSLRNVLGHEPVAGGRVADLLRIEPDDLPDVQDAARRVLAGGRSSAVLFRARHADRSVRWLEARLAPILDDHGTVLEVHSAARDVTERVRAAQELAQVAEQAAGLVETCADALVSVDEHDTVVDWNPAAAATFGWSREEAIGRDLSDLIVPAELRPQHRAGMARLREGGEARILGQQVQVTGQRRDGSQLPVELTLWRSRGRDGWRYNAFLRDVTDRVAGEAALSAARDDAERRAALTTAILQTIDVGVVACDAQGRLTAFNRAAHQLHGRTEEPGVDPAEWAARHDLRAEDGETVLAVDQVPLNRALAGEEVRDVPMVIAPEGMAPRTVSVDGRVMHDSGGRLLGAVVALKDVTQARAHAQELTEARDLALASTRAKTAFLAAASHEIRTPLNGVLGTVELLELEPLTARQAEYVAVARRSGEALLRLLNDVLDLSKAETTAVDLASEDFSPAAVARDVTAAMTPVAARKGLSVVLDAPTDQLLVGDPGRLRQVLMNLVGNAVKFTAHGQVVVAVEFSAAGAGLVQLRLSVRDTGAGMCAEELAGLFQPFSQGAQGQRYGGTGLGLALSQQLVELMGGRVDVQSTPGSGSLFVVVVDLPLARTVPAPTAETSAAGAVPPPADEGRPGGARPPRVLIADDSEVNLMVAAALLGSAGAEVVTVEDGDEAVAAVQRERFDLVLLDNQMPRMSGVEAASAIRALPGPAGATRLVALTASTGEDQRAAFAAAGVQGFLTKPVRLADFRRLLAEATAD
ncbi:PAS domain S-box protein [Modestobacter sp. VKM Ac-2985]|uniref:PAS domain S-box protein n=1 Tax=Modestobacter sp. VKM Ac-2985 TaxID=3004139 RepID=UPI0022AB5557|nr:PAS domain S-box protein [Modestobacter sp. VKM Ac-2985]MCZ2837946.1 PAS domain S-box protein [Modestobacter sp. VKM Ac-2985]